MVKKKTRLEIETAIPPFMAGDDKRSVILRAARKMFLQDGFSATSMDAITREAGVSKATVYAHFDSKEKLFETLIRMGSEAAINSMPPLERRGGEPREELLAFFGPLLDKILGAGGYAWDRMVIAEAHRHPTNARLFFDCTIDRITQTVEHYLRGLSKDGLFSNANIRLSAEALIAVVLLGPLQRTLLIGPEMVDWRQSLAFGIELVLGKPNAS